VDGIDEKREHAKLFREGRTDRQIERRVRNISTHKVDSKNENIQKND
jgi:hypothetical protein